MVYSLPNVPRLPPVPSQRRFSAAAVAITPPNSHPAAAARRPPRCLGTFLVEALPDAAAAEVRRRAMRSSSCCCSNASGSTSCRKNFLLSTHRNRRLSWSSSTAPNRLSGGSSHHAGLRDTGKSFSFAAPGFNGEAVAATPHRGYFCGVYGYPPAWDARSSRDMHQPIINKGKVAAATADDGRSKFIDSAGSDRTHGSCSFSRACCDEGGGGGAAAAAQALTATDPVLRSPVDACSCSCGRRGSTYSRLISTPGSIIPRPRVITAGTPLTSPRRFSFTPIRTESIFPSAAAVAQNERQLQKQQQLQLPPMQRPLTVPSCFRAVAQTLMPEQQLLHTVTKPPCVSSSSLQATQRSPLAIHIYGGLDSLVGPTDPPPPVKTIPLLSCVPQSSSFSSAVNFSSAGPPAVSSPAPFAYPAAGQWPPLSLISSSPAASAPSCCACCRCSSPSAPPAAAFSADALSRLTTASSATAFSSSSRRPFCCSPSSSCSSGGGDAAAKQLLAGGEGWLCNNGAAYPTNPLHVKEKKVEVPLVRRVDTLVPAPRIEEKITFVDKPIIQQIERFVEVPEIHYNDIIVEVPEVIHVEKRVPKEKIVENVIFVPRFEEKVIPKYVEIPVVKIVDRYEEVQQIEEVLKPIRKVEVVEVPREVQRLIPKYIVHKTTKEIPVPVLQHKAVPRHKVKYEPKIVKKEVRNIIPEVKDVEVPYPVPVVKEVPAPYLVEKYRDHPVAVPVSHMVLPIFKEGLHAQQVDVSVPKPVLVVHDQLQQMAMPVPQLLAGAAAAAARPLDARSLHPQQLAILNQRMHAQQQSD